jgi:hypothetical protein
MCPYGRPKSICVEDIHMDHREAGYENGRWIKLAQGHVHWWGGFCGSGVHSGEFSYCSVV